ncbi:SGNH/GDSL hydrolase family protein [Streptomyces ramulosus]
MAAGALAALGLGLAACGAGPDAGVRPAGQKTTTAAAPEKTGKKVLWMGDSIAAAESPALGAALAAGGVDFKDASSDGGGTVVAGGDRITNMISADTWKALDGNLASFRPTVVAYQLTTYDWGTRKEQRAAYEKLVAKARDAGARTVFVPTPPIKIDDFYQEHAPQMRTAASVAQEVARKSGGAALYLDASRLWGTDPAAKKAQRAADGIHNCQQGAAAFADWFATELGESEGFTPAPVDDWARGSWTGNDRYATLKCDR